MPAWIKYTLIRLGIFVVVLLILLWIGVNPYISAVVAAVAGFVLSYIFFRKLRTQVAEEMARRSAKPEPIKNVDTEAEDEVLDAQDAAASGDTDKQNAEKQDS